MTLPRHETRFGVRKRAIAGPPPASSLRPRELCWHELEERLYIGVGTDGDHAASVVDVTAAALAVLSAYAPLASPHFTGAPTAPTPAAGDNTTRLATSAFVTAAITAAIDAVVGAAPGQLNTLQELADALADDANFAADMSAALAAKANLSGAAFTGEVASSSANAFRMTFGSDSYGVIARKDSATFYLLLTNAGDVGGGWNSLRPFAINLANGNVNIGTTLGVNGGLVLSGGAAIKKFSVSSAAPGTLADGELYFEYA